MLHVEWYKPSGLIYSVSCLDEHFNSMQKFLEDFVTEIVAIVRAWRWMSENMLMFLLWLKKSLVAQCTRASGACNILFMYKDFRSYFICIYLQTLL